jgi:hypothetical protein
MPGSACVLQALHLHVVVGVVILFKRDGGQLQQCKRGEGCLSRAPRKTIRAGNIKRSTTKWQGVPGPPPPGIQFSHQSWRVPGCSHSHLRAGREALLGAAQLADEVVDDLIEGEGGQGGDLFSFGGCEHTSWVQTRGTAGESAALVAARKAGQHGRLGQKPEAGICGVCSTVCQHTRRAQASARQEHQAVSQQLLAAGDSSSRRQAGQVRSQQRGLTASSCAGPSLAGADALGSA